MTAPTPDPADSDQVDPNVEGGDVCAGEDRADPDSWDDPSICGPWEEPPAVEPVGGEQR